METVGKQGEVFCFVPWLRSVVGERGKWSGGRRGAHSALQPERNAPPPSRGRKPAAFAELWRCLLVTSARFAKWNGRRRKGDGATDSPWSEANRVLVTAAKLDSVSRGF